MSQFKLNIAVGCSVLALALSAFNVIQTKLTSNMAIPLPLHQIQPQQQATLPTYNNSQLATNENQLQELQSTIARLESRIIYLESQNPADLANNSPEQFEALIASLIEKREKEKLDEMKSKNPIYGFYEDLPEDYEIRIKTDPEYAAKVSDELKQKILNAGLSPAERLAAMSQLQMNMFMLNRNQLEQYDYQAVESIMNMTHNMTDEKLRLQAIELVSRTPIVDERLSDSFVKLLENEQNDYVKTLAAEGLMSQYFQSGSNEKQKRKVARDLLSLYEEASDPKVKAILKNLMGDQQMIEELKQQAGG
ncbi:hypothetical protein ACSLBF_19760 (plasmid) [Pseudoalteromonas sp. T1lg65]|uniref:hypothetical protein n=1 Tax=Pseudoalteromonas sp. T1lg65 TaxID=2077101 RepID=UPI003F7AEC60